MSTATHVEPITDRHAAAYAEAVAHCPKILTRLGEKAAKSTSQHAANAAPILAACIPVAYRTGAEQAHTDDAVEQVAKSAWHACLAILKKRAARQTVTDAIRHGLTDDGILPEGDSSLWMQEAPRADAGTVATDRDRLAAALTVAPVLADYVDAFRTEAKRRAAAVETARAEQDPAALMSAARSLAGLTLSGARTTAEDRKRDSKQARRYNAETADALALIATVADALNTDPNHAATHGPAQRPAPRQPAAPILHPGTRATGATVTTTTTQTPAAHPLTTGHVPIPSTGTAPRWALISHSDHRAFHHEDGCHGAAYALTHHHPTYHAETPTRTEHAHRLPAQDAAPATYGPDSRTPSTEAPGQRRYAPRPSHWTAPAVEARPRWTAEQAATAAALIERPGTLGDSQQEKSPSDLPTAVYRPPFYPYPYTGPTRRAHGPAAPAGWITTTKPERTEQESDRPGEEHMRGEATHASTDRTASGTTRAHKAPSKPRAKRSDNGSSIPARAVTTARRDATATDDSLAAVSAAYYAATGKDLSSMDTAGTNAAAGRDTAAQIAAMQAAQRATLNAR